MPTIKLLRSKSYGGKIYKILSKPGQYIKVLKKEILAKFDNRKSKDKEKEIKHQELEEKLKYKIIKMWNNKWEMRV